MIEVNDNFRQLPQSYLFSEVAKRIAAFKAQHPGREVIRMDIGDVTRPLFPVVVEAIKEAAAELGNRTTFRGYGPEQGYAFLREAIARHDYADRGIEMEETDIFVSDGAKSDLGNLGDIYSRSCRVAVMNPSYPVYVDDSAIDGRAGNFDNGKWSKIIYLDCSPENNFLPALPEEKADVIFLCFPNNPTGEAITRGKLQEWVDYARRNGSLIIYDSAYEAFVRGKDTVRSIYEIEGAREVAVEVRSFSKTAGFTGLRCGYTVVPKELTGKYADGSQVSLNQLWNRRQTTKFNGASYVAQKAAAAVYTPEGLACVKESTDYYINNAGVIRRALDNLGFSAFGGIDSPYVWASLPDSSLDSWQLFAKLLTEFGFSTTPGSGFGSNGNGFIRLTGFNTLENTRRAMEALAQGF